jgi:hypothetical protein
MNLETFKVLYPKFIPPKRKATSSRKKRTPKKSKKVQSEEDVEEDSENVSESEDCLDSEISGFMSLDKLILLKSSLSDDVYE